MASFEPGKVYRFTAVFDFGDTGEVQNVYHFINDGTATVDLQDVLNPIIDHFNDLYFDVKTGMSDILQSQRIDVYNETDGFAVGSVAWPNIVGGATTDTLPPGTAAQVDLTTTEPTVRGRKYLGVFAEGSQDEGILTAGVTALISDYLVAMGIHIVDALGLDLKHAVWSKKNLAAYEIVGGVIQAVVAYQRRRKQNVGS